MHIKTDNIKVFNVMNNALWLLIYQKTVNYTMPEVVLDHWNHNALLLYIYIYIYVYIGNTPPNNKIIVSSSSKDSVVGIKKTVKMYVASSLFQYVTDWVGLDLENT